MSRLTFKELTAPYGDGYQMRDLSEEAYREYVNDGEVFYRIDDPIALITRTGGTTHRVVDADGVVHCVPVGPLTVIKWVNRNRYQPVNF